MEEVYPRPNATKESAVFLRQFGKGRVLYFPCDIDRTFREVLDWDQAKLLRNAVQWAHGEPQPLEVHGSGVLDVAIWRQENSMTVHLVNLINPMLMKGPVREVIPIGPQDSTIHAPGAKPVAKARLLVAGGSVPFEADGAVVKISVPWIAVHEVVALEF